MGWDVELVEMLGVGVGHRCRCKRFVTCCTWLHACMVAGVRATCI